MALPIYSAHTLSHEVLSYRYKISTKSQVIYILFLVSLSVFFAALPFVKMRISVKSTGILHSSIERTDLNIPVNGKLLSINIKDNQKLKKGDTLLVLDASLPHQQDVLLKSRIVQVNHLLQDIEKLLKAPGLGVPNLQTGQYNASWLQYIQEVENLRLVKDQAERVYNRNEKLFQSNVLTTSEFEKYKFEYQQSVLAYLVLIKKYRSQWNVEANHFRTELSQLNSQKVDIAAQKKLYTLFVPVNGSAQYVSGLQTGTYLFANQKIGEISPDAILAAICYVKPSDIGLVNIGQQVSFQVDAFNYNQWGLSRGKVMDISDDIVILRDNQAVFKVKCSLDSEYLELKNGYRGKLLKGMNFTARFIVAERSLYQLLYDKVDNWVNPNIIQQPNLRQQAYGH